MQAGPDQTYSYIACGQHAVTDSLFAEATPTSSSSFIPTIATPSNTSPSSTGTSSSTSSTVLEAASLASDPSHSSVNNTGAIVGGVIGGLAFIFLAAFAIFFLRLYSKRHVRTNPEQTPTREESPPRIQLGVNRELAELSSKSRLAYELPGKSECVLIELDSVSLRSFHDTEFS